MAPACQPEPRLPTGRASRKRLATIGANGDPTRRRTPMRIAIASDHAGFQLKELLISRFSAEPDLSIVDLGTYTATPPVDYPDYAQAAAGAVVRGDVDRAIVVCGSGAGACMAASKVPGARA